MALSAKREETKAYELDLPFAGGTLVPSPDLIFVVALDANGEARFRGNWPGSIPAGEDFYLQVILLDPLAVRGLSGSNALMAVAH